MSDQKQQETKQDRPLTRIPLSVVRFRSALDFPGGNAIAESISFVPQKTKGRQFFLGWFVPAHQVVHVEWYLNENTAPRRFVVPMGEVTLAEEQSR